MAKLTVVVICSDTEVGDTCAGPAGPRPAASGRLARRSAVWRSRLREAGRDVGL